jgi:hypothetical protein
VGTNGPENRIKPSFCVKGSLKTEQFFNPAKKLEKAPKMAYLRHFRGLFWLWMTP